MPAFIDLTGHTYARLTVLSQTLDKRGKRAWFCQCSCGTILVVIGESLRSGNTRSCGCYKNELISVHSRTHGKTQTTEHGIWANMIQRCHNPNVPLFKNYGGRGITVCAAWHASFAQFYADMGPRPTPKYSLERRRNNGPYSKKNCCWALKIQQANNTRRNQFVIFQGRKQTISQWAREFHLRPGALRTRLIVLRWSISRALTYPLRHNFLTFQGKTQTIGQWAREMHINPKTLQGRLHRWHWPIERALMQPLKHTLRSNSNIV